MTNCISECGYNEINTYQDMNEQIVRLLRFSNTGPSLYAAKYIEDLQAEVERLQKAVAAEREACAVVCEAEGRQHPGVCQVFANILATLIRDGDGVILSKRADP